MMAPRGHHFHYRYVMILNDSHKHLVRAIIEANEPRLVNGYSLSTAIPHVQAEYLGANPNRMLFGSFDGDRLVCIVGIRKHYPVYGSAIICNYFATPDDSSASKKVEAVDALYDEALASNIHTLYSCFMVEHYSNQIYFGMRYGKTGRLFDRFHVCEYIPKGEKPSQDWMWVMMGMRPAPGDVGINQITFDGGEGYALWKAKRKAKLESLA